MSKTKSDLYEKLKLLIKKQEPKQVEELVISSGSEKIIQELSQVLRVPEGATLSDGLLSSLQGLSRESLSCKLKIFECVFEFVRIETGGSSGIGGINPNVMEGLMGVLMTQLLTLPTHTLMPFVDQYTELVKIGEPLQGRWLELLPKLLNTLSEREDVSVGTREMTGEEYRYQVLKTLCDYAWPSQTTNALLLAIKELKLEKEEMVEIVNKVERVMRKSKYQDIPPIVYQLVLTSQSQLPGVALKAVVTYFNVQEDKMALLEKKISDSSVNDASQAMDDISSADKDEDNAAYERRLRDLREAQGTVILHLTHLAQFDPSLAKEYIKLLKGSTWLPHVLCSPFNLPLSLSLASIERYQDQVLDAVRSCLLHSFLQQQRRQRCAWLRKTWPSSVDLQAVIRATITNCAVGWEQVSNGICLVLLQLLEGGTGVKGDAAVMSVSSLPLLVTRHTRLVQHCLQHIANCTITANSKQHYVEVLGRLSRVCPLLLLEHHGAVQEAVMEQLQLLDQATATHVLHAISCSLRVDLPLRDALVIALRKMLFSKGVEGRVVGVLGILLLLRQLRVVGTLPSSQASMSFSSSLSQISFTQAHVHSGSSNDRNQALCYELLGVLRRCFSHQQQVRSALYGGLLDVCRANPKLCPNILSLLHQHLINYIDLKPDALNPIVTKKTIQVQGEIVTLVEPLGELLSCFASCKLHYESKRAAAENNTTIDDDDDDDEENSVTVLNDACLLFDVLGEKLSTCDLDDLEFDNRAEFSAASVAGQKSILSAQVMVGVYDGVIEHTFYTREAKLEDKLRKCVALFKMQRKIVDLVKTKSVKKGEGSKGKGRTAAKNSVSFNCILRLSVIVDFLSTTLGEEDDVSEDASKILKDCFEFQIYMLTALESIVAKHKNLPPYEKDRQVPHFRKAARVLFVECFQNFNQVESDDDREVNRLRQCIGLVNNLLFCFGKFHKDKLEQILKEITNKSASKDLDALSYVLFKGCQKMLVRILHNENNGPLMKDATTIVQIMSQVCKFVNHDSDVIERTYEWTVQLAKDQVVTYAPFCEEFLKLMFLLADQHKANHTHCHAIAVDIYHCLGDNDQNVSVNDSEVVHAIVNEDTVSSAITVLMAQIDDTLALVEMSLTKLRAYLVTATDHDDNKVEENINVKFGSIIKTMNEIIRSALPLGPIMDLVIKKADKLYGILALFVRYYLDLFRIKNYPKISEKFEKLVHMSGELLSDPLYLFLNYIEDARSNGKGVALQTAIKESKMIPALIFAIEKYEKLVIQLSKKSKVNLMTGMKLSTLRDFKIETDKLMQKEEDEDEDDTGEDEQDGTQNRTQDGTQNRTQDTTQNRTQDGTQKGTQKKAAPKRKRKAETEPTTETAPKKKKKTKS